MIQILTDKKQLNDLYELDKKIFQDSYYKLNEYENMFLSNNYFFYFILKNNYYAGFLILYKIDDGIEIIKIAINIEFQKLGLGSYLIDFIKSKYNRIILEVSSNNDNAINFYLKHNFKQYHIRKKYYYDNSDAILMEWCNDNY